MQSVLAVVAEQTGYPPEMLDLELDLEADLGIDTVKQAETFAAIREEYGIERDDSLALRDYPTLNDVIGFVYAKRPDLSGAAAEGMATAAPTTAPSVAPTTTLLSGDDVAAAEIARRQVKGLNSIVDVAWIEPAERSEDCVTRSS